MNPEIANYTPSICVIEDDPIMGEALRQRLGLEGFEVDLYDRAHTAYDKLRHDCYDIILCDILLPDMNGADLYHKLFDDKGKVPPTIFMTAHGTVENAVTLLKLGATDYITKPFNPETLISKLKSISLTIGKPTHDKHNTNKLGISPPMSAIEQHLNKLAQYYETPLLVTGETGVGKEVVARYLHHLRPDRGPFVAINCSAIPESLIESELFGHERGAFTGASRKHKGVFEQAKGGTLLLDEIADLPLFLQAKLLRVLQEHTVKRVGGEQDVEISTRLIFATNKDLEQQVENGQFREDLFFRINVVHTLIPPLRERKQDILWLAERFINEHQQHYPGANISLHESAKRALIDYHWPGNVRELKHAIERACIMCEVNIIRAHDISTHASAPGRVFNSGNTSLREYLESLEKEKIESVLVQNSGNVSKSAAQLDICRKSLWEKMRKYNIEKKYTISH